MNITEIKHNEKTVSIISKEEWIYDGIEMGKIRALNLDLFNEVQKAVTYYMDNKERLIEEQRIKEKQIKYNKWVEEHTAFKLKILSENAPILKGQEISFEEPEIDNYSYNAQRLKVGTIEIYFDDEVSSPSGYSTHKTSKVWVVYADYKKARYAKLETAIKKAVEKNIEAIEEREAKEASERGKVYAEERMKKFAEANSFEFEKNWHSNYSRYNRSSGGYYTYEMKKVNDENKTVVRAEIQYARDLNMVVITRYSVNNNGNKEGLNLEEVKKLVGDAE